MRAIREVLELDGSNVTRKLCMALQAALKTLTILKKMSLLGIPALQIKTNAT